MPTGEPDMQPLLEYLRKIPAVHPSMGSGLFPSGLWWVKFRIDVGHPLSWRVVQELAHVLNYISADERLPTVFMPVSPPPYLNGGTEFLSWVIEAKDRSFLPEGCAKWLHGRLPRPVEDISKWDMDEEDDHEDD